MRVLVVDDHPVFRQGLRAVLEATEWVEEVVEADGAASAVTECICHAVDVVVMDLGLPDGSGIDAIPRVLKARPSVSVLVLTLTKDADRVAEALAAGARGYVLKEAQPDALVEAIHAVSAGSLVLGPEVNLPTREAVDGGVIGTLSERERQILGELARGRSNAQIARSMGLGEKTVRNHLSHVYAKLGVSDRTQAALLARGQLP